MKNSIYALATALVLTSTFALAGPSGGDGSCTGNCPTTQGPGGSNDNTNDNSSEANASAAAASISGSNSSSTSNSSSGDVRSSVLVRTGGSRSSSTATSGDSTATGGTAVAAGGKAKATGGNSGGNTQNLSYAEVSSAASSASVFSGYCQAGGSGQTMAGGFSVSNPEAFCNHIRLAAVYQESHTWELSNGSEEQAAEYLGLYRENLAEANGMLNATEGVAKVDAFFGYLVRPLGVLALLLLL